MIRILMIPLFLPNYKTFAQLAAVTYSPSGLMRACRSSVGGFSATVNEPFQWSVEFTFPYRSREVSIQSTSKLRSLVVGRTDFTSTDTLPVCARLNGGSLR